jgi:hypothetical protein
MRNQPGVSMGAVHWAAPSDHRTACGRWAKDDDGTQLLETDADKELVTCRNCKRAGRP